MNTNLLKWAEKYVPMFNELSEKYQTSFCTQSPLTEIEESVELMIIGINPGGGSVGNGHKCLDVVEFLKGNPF